MDKIYNEIKIMDIVAVMKRPCGPNVDLKKD